MSDADPDLGTRPTCDECGSKFEPARSAMAGLCRECAHLLYGYPACPHSFVEGRCAECGWDGSHSEFTRQLSEARPA